jgi:hypothetical protein
MNGPIAAFRYGILLMAPRVLMTISNHIKRDTGCVGSNFNHHTMYVDPYKSL